MKKACIHILLAITVLLSLPGTSKANYAAGGELIYIHISDSTYQFFFKLYRDCSGNAEPDSVQLCFNNPCNNSSFSRYMTKWTGTQQPPIGPICAQMKSNCDSLGSPVQAYKEIWYWKTVTMPSRCNSWRIFTYSTTRNSIYNLQNALSSTMYVEARMNNSITHNNSSPYYSVRPPYGAAQSSPFTYNAGAIDADGDSVWTDLVMLRTGVSSCTDTPNNMSFNTASPSYNLSTNPIGTNNTFGINGGTGQMGFTPTMAGKANVVLRTREYRNGVMIGSIMREMQIMTLNFSGVVPTYTAIRGCGAPGTGTINGCAGTPLSFCIDFLSSDTTSRLFLTTSLATSIPGATMVFTNQGKDSVRGTFTWTPTANDIGNHSFVTLMVDSLCKAGIPLNQAFITNLTIWGKINAGPDTFVCSGSSVPLHVTGGGGYQWTVVSGTPNSLNNPNIANPIASPTVTTTYAVQSMNTSFCPQLNKDTVTVAVVPLTYPSINITVSPDSNINSGTNVVFIAGTANCSNPGYQWKLNGTNIPGATNSTYSSSTLNDNDKISCMLTCADSCPSPQDTVSNVITMHVTSSINELSAEPGIEVYPNPNKGEFVVKRALVGTRIIICNLYGQEIYTGTAAEDETRILVPELPDGIYLLKAQSALGTKTIRINIIN